MEAANGLRFGPRAPALESAEGALIAWLVGLPHGADPARAALAALAAMPAVETETAWGAHLRALLAEVAQTRVESLPPHRRRRRRPLSTIR